MKKIFLFLTLLISFAVSFGQGRYGRPFTNYGDHRLREWYDSTLTIPSGETPSINDPEQPTLPGRIYYKTTDSSVYVFTGTQFILVSRSGTAGATNVGFRFSPTAPTDTTVAWVNTSVNFLSSYPIQWRINGAWSTLDTLGGFWYDDIGKILSRGRPITMAVTGQSNLLAPYDPNPVGAAKGDTIPSQAVTVWDTTLKTFRVAKLGDYPYLTTISNNYVVIAAKKLALETGRSVRMVVFSSGGQQANCWTIGSTDSACAIEFKREMNQANMRKPDYFIWGQGEASSTGDYYTLVTKIYDSLNKQGYLDSTKTLILAMGTGDPSGQSLNSPATGGNAGLRRIGNDQNLRTIYVDVACPTCVSALSDGLHWYPYGSQVVSERLYTAIKHGVLDPRQQDLGYNGISAHNNTLDSSSTYVEGQTGKSFTYAGKPFYRYFSGTGEVGIYHPASALARTGLYMTASNSTLTIAGFGGGSLTDGNDGYLRAIAYSNGFYAQNKITVSSGSVARIALTDGSDEWQWTKNGSSGLAFNHLNTNYQSNGPTFNNTVFGTTATPALNPMAQVSIESTGGGFRLPVMTTAQRDAIRGVTSISASGGTGYTGGSSITFTGGGGSGALGTINVSGGVVTSANLNSTGRSYTGTPTLSAPTGTGATFTPTMGTIAGLLVADSSGDRPAYSTTSGWKRLAFLEDGVGGGGSVGTVTSVGLEQNGGGLIVSPAISISNSPITSSGNISIDWQGDSGEYVAGDGSLVTFPTRLSSVGIVQNAGVDPLTPAISFSNNPLTSNGNISVDWQGSSLEYISGDGNRVTFPTTFSPVGSSLTSGKIWLGDASNIAAAVTPSGDVTINNAGVTAIGSSKVTNTMLAGSIALNKLSALTASRVMVTDGSGVASASTVTSTNLTTMFSNYVDKTVPNTYTAGAKQTFQADATNSGFRFGGVTANPSSPAAGDVWYRSDDGFLRYYDGNASTVRTLVNLAGAQTLTNKDLSSGTNTFPTFNQNSTGSAGSVTNALSISAELISGGASSYNGSAAKSIAIQSASVTNAMLAGSIDLTAKVTGVLPPANGGTGVNNSTRTLTVNSNSGTINFSAASKTLTVPLDASVSGTNTGDQTISITGDGTASGSTGSLTLAVTKLNGTSLAGLATGLIKNTTSTGVPSIAVSGTDYAPATSGSSPLKGNGSGGFTNGVATTDLSDVTEWTDYSGTSTITGYGSFTTKVLRYKISGKSMTIDYNLIGTGNASTTTSFTLPNSVSANDQVWFSHTKNNTTQAAGYTIISASSNTVNISTTTSDGNLSSWSSTVARTVQGQAVLVLP